MDKGKDIVYSGKTYYIAGGTILAVGAVPIIIGFGSGGIVGGSIAAAT